MEIAHGPLARTFTAPTSQNSRIHASNSSLSLSQQGQQDSHNSSSSRPSRSSDSTYNASHSSGSGLQTPWPNGPVANDNVTNRIADKESSLFQKCVVLRSRLSQIPNFKEWVDDVEEDPERVMDPVELLWETLKEGYPLLVVYNALNQGDLAVSDRTSEKQRPKAAGVAFLKACISQLGFPPDDCFMINDLWGSDANGFNKVVRVLAKLVDKLVDMGVIDPTKDDNLNIADSGVGGGKRTHRQHVVKELVDTERTYVQQLGVLQEYAASVNSRGIITGDAIHDIFLNLNSLLDFQQRFLIKVESVNHQSEDRQNWGKLFLDHAPGFSVYEPYLENQKRCEESARLHYPRLKEAGGSSLAMQLLESPQNFTGFLLKPFQRLAKYPLLLTTLRDKGDVDQDRRQDLTAAINAITAVLDRCNDFLAREERIQVVLDLKEQVEDWKSHRLEGFGELMLHGTYNVIKGDPQRDALREYRMYLFEKILLCCKEMNPNKPKSKMMKQAQSASLKGKPRLQLKGRIFMQNVTETRVNPKQGNYTMQIFWRGDTDTEDFVVRFPNEDVMKKWHEHIESQRKMCQQNARNHAGVSNSDPDLTIVGHEQAQDEYGEDYDLDGSFTMVDSATYNSSNNASNTSLRSRSTTGDSGPTRGASNIPAGFTTSSLTLRTQQLNTISPVDRPNNSYFSPGAESPISSRSSSSMQYPFPRQSTQSQHSQERDHRNTAPAMARAAMGRESSGSYNYQQDGRSSSRGQSGGGLINRLRSASSPDPNHKETGRRKPSNQTAPPPVPSVPQHLAQSNSAVNRSQNNSPILANGHANGPRSPLPPGMQMYSQGAEQNDSGYFPPRRDSRNPGDVFSMPLHSGGNGLMSPPLESPTAPSQIKVKVKVPSEGSTMTLVVAYNISYHQLKDRIDAKLQRYSSASLSSGAFKLKYVSDDDFVTIQNDEDVQTAFETWQEQFPEGITGKLGEVELHVHR